MHNNNNEIHIAFNSIYWCKISKDIIDLYAQKIDIQQKVHIQMQQKVTYSTHIHGGILDLVFDFKDSNGKAYWKSTPFLIFYHLQYVK